MALACPLRNQVYDIAPRSVNRATPDPSNPDPLGGCLPATSSVGRSYAGPLRHDMLEHLENVSPRRRKHAQGIQDNCGNINW